MLVNQDLELVEIQFQPILYLILLVPFLQVQLINHLRQHHPKEKKLAIEITLDLNFGGFLLLFNYNRFPLIVIF